MKMIKAFFDGYAKIERLVGSCMIQLTHGAAMARGVVGLRVLSHRAIAEKLKQKTSTDKKYCGRILVNAEAERMREYRQLR